MNSTRQIGHLERRLISFRNRDVCADMHLRCQSTAHARKRSEGSLKALERVSCSQPEVCLHIHVDSDQPPIHTRAPVLRSNWTRQTHPCDAVRTAASELTGFCPSWTTTWTSIDLCESLSGLCLCHQRWGSALYGLHLSLRYHFTGIGFYEANRQR